MMFAEAQFDTPAERLARWSGSAGLVAAMHLAAAVLLLIGWTSSAPRNEDRPGAIMMELPSLAAESPSDQQDLSEQPQFEQAAPPPSPTEALEETPPEPSPVAAAEPAPEQVAEATDAPPLAEPVTEPLPELPTLEEAPLAPEPEFTLPKTSQTAETPEQPKEKAKKKPKSKESTAKAAQKSDSHRRQQAAASASGRFDPTPIYRAKPAYPADARARKIEGHVVVVYSVSASGAVSNVRIVSASPPGIFNSATLSAVRQWRFKPSPQGAQGRRTTIRFKLR